VEGFLQSARWIEAELRAGRPAELPLRGSSMTPALCDGDRLEVRPLAQAPAPGEIVVARRGQRLVTHRVVHVRPDGVVTRGDACAKDDPPIPPAALLGRVSGVLRGCKRLRPPRAAGPLARALRRYLGALARRLRTEPAQRGDRCP